MTGALVAWALAASAARPARAGALFGYTHLLPSPFTLPAGRLAFGTEIAYGVTDFFQVGSSVVRDIYKNYNANAKLSLVDVSGFALAPTLGFETYNYHDIADSNPDLSVTSWLPGLVAAFELAPSEVALFVGGNLNLTKTKLVTDGLTTSGFIRGAALGSDLSWAYNHSGDGEPAAGPSKRGTRVRQPQSNASSARVGHVLSAGASYDFTYRLFGVGVSHHWPGFHLGVHYYPSATRYGVMPIIAGGGSVDL